MLKNPRRLGVVLVASLLLPAGSFGQGGGRPPLGGTLPDADHKEFSARFQRDVWPLLVKGGIDGCVGCHNKKHRSGLGFSSDPGKDFTMLLHKGFLLKGDPGSLLATIVTTNPKRLMPPGKRPRWKADEVKVLADFVNDLHRRQREAGTGG